VHDCRNPGYYNQFFARVHELEVHENVLLLGVLPKMEQFQLLRGSIALIQPSLFEGWHTGVEEARLAGKTVLLSDIPVHREQDPPNAVYFHPAKPEELADRMITVFDDLACRFDSRREEHARQAYARLQEEYAMSFLRLAKRTSPAALHTD
jgi:glycosyltransferase involved in cell wall biosynthesis